LLLTFGLRFNYSGNGRYDPDPIGEVGWAYSLFLLHNYGDVIREDKFYAEKYFKAFPMLMGFNSTSIQHPVEYPYFIYSTRTFNHFLHHFGLVEILQKNPFTSPKLIKKSPLLDTLLCVKSPNK
jgi:hypothetical protein